MKTPVLLLALVISGCCGTQYDRQMTTFLQAGYTPHSLPHDGAVWATRSEGNVEYQIWRERMNGNELPTWRALVSVYDPHPPYEFISDTILSAQIYQDVIREVEAWRARNGIARVVK